MQLNTIIFWTNFDYKLKRTVKTRISLTVCGEKPRAIPDKVIKTMVIWPLDDRTGYAQSVSADLQHLGLGYVGVGDGLIR